MSTYDAYNLSVRDSTEFTVPTGGGDGTSEDNLFDIVDVTINVGAGVGDSYSVTGAFYDINEQYEDMYNTDKITAGVDLLREDANIIKHVIIPRGGVSGLQIDGFNGNASVTGDITYFGYGVFFVRGSGSISLSSSS